VCVCVDAYLQLETNTVDWSHSLTHPYPSRIHTPTHIGVITGDKKLWGQSQIVTSFVLGTKVSVCVMQVCVCV
jgi:hypothetical protein